MISVKVLKPYYLKINQDKIHVILDHQYFTIAISGEVFHFVPKRDKEIIINRRTQQVLNTDAVLAFQKGLAVKYISMSDLISVPDFLIQLYAITRIYKHDRNDDVQAEQAEETELVIAELENINVRRLIDQALDNRDKETFHDLAKHYNGI